MPEISVIVPVYKVEAYLHRCVDSILAQTFSDFELILVDDGSPDNCPEICDKYAEKDNRIKVIHQKNGGLSAARNAGIDWVFANSDSDYFAFIDSDDWVHPRYLELLHKAIKKYNTAVSMCRLERTDEYIDKYNENVLEPILMNTEDAYIDEPIAAVAYNKLYKRECFNEIRYPLGKIHEDEFTTYKILFAYKSIAVIQDTLYFYFTNPNGIMRTKWSPKRLHAIEAVEEQIKFFKENGYDKAYNRMITGFIACVASAYNKMGEEYFEEYRPILKKKLRNWIRKNKKNISFDDWCVKCAYEILYPKRMCLYWKLKGIKDKFFKK